MIETDCARAEDSVMQDFSEMANVSTLNFNDRTHINRSSADDGIRTRDLRFTKPLLYQLSYVGGKRAKHCIPWPLTQAVCCSGFAAHEELKRPRRLDFSGGVCDARAARVS